MVVTPPPPPASSTAISCVFSFTAFQSRYSQSLTLESETGGGWESCMAGKVLSFAGRPGATVPPTIRHSGPSVKNNLCVQGMGILCVHALPKFSANVGGLYIKRLGLKFAPHPRLRAGSECGQACASEELRVRVQWAGRARVERVWWAVRYASGGWRSVGDWVRFIFKKVLTTA